VAVVVHALVLVNIDSNMHGDEIKRASYEFTEDCFGVTLYASVEV